MAGELQDGLTLNEIQKLNNSNVDKLTGDRPVKYTGFDQKLGCLLVFGAIGLTACTGILLLEVYGPEIIQWVQTIAQGHHGLLSELAEGVANHTDLSLLHRFGDIIGSSSGIFSPQEHVVTPLDSIEKYLIR